MREKEHRDMLYEDSFKVWETYILPNWDTAYDPSTKTLIAAFEILKRAFYIGMGFLPHDVERSGASPSLRMLI